MKTLTEELNGFEYETEIDDTEHRKNLDSIHEIIEEFIPQGSNYAFTLHKYDDQTKKWPQIGKWRNSMPPDKHEIGVQYGSGTYQFYLKWPDKSKKLGYAIKESKFDLHKSYDDLKLQAERERKREEQALLFQPLHGNQSNDKIFEMLLAQSQNEKATLITLFTTVLNAFSGRNIENPMDKYFPMLLESQLKTKEIDSERMYTMFSKGIEMGTINNSENSKDTSWKDLLKELIPQLPAMVNNASKMFIPKSSIRNIALADPRAQKILAAPNGREEFVKEMIATHGPEKTVETLQKAGLDDLMTEEKMTQQTSKIKVW